MWYIILQTKATKTVGGSAVTRGELWSTSLARHDAGRIAELLTSHGGAGEVVWRGRTYKACREMMIAWDKHASKTLAGTGLVGRAFNSRVIAEAREFFKDR